MQKPFSVDKFLSHCAEKNRRDTFVFQKNSGIEKFNA